MMKTASLLGLLALALTTPAWGQQPPSAQELARLRKLPKSQLLGMLEHPETRTRAYYELCRRAGDDSEEPGEFFPNHPRVEALHLKGKPGFWLVLRPGAYPFLLDEEEDDLRYEVEKPDALFGPSPYAKLERLGWRADNEPTWFTEAGERVEHFSPAGRVWQVPEAPGRALSGVFLKDLDRDGRPELAEAMRISAGHRRQGLLLVVRSGPRERDIRFAVLFDITHDEFESFDWDYELSDTGRELRLGPPFGPAGVTFRWDSRQRTFTGPSSGDHWVVLDLTKGIEAEVHGLLRTTRPFPRARVLAPQLSPSDRPAWSALAPKVTRPTPPGFWTSKPRGAARAFVEHRRSPEHRAAYQLELDDRGVRPPLTGTIQLTDRRVRGYSGIDTKHRGRTHLIFRCEAQGGYLAFVAASGAPARSLLGEPQTAEVRFCRLGAAEARFMLQTIWWLDRVRTRAMMRSGGASICAAGSDVPTTLALETPTETLELEADRWGLDFPIDYGFADRWGGDYDREVFLNLVAELLEEVWPGHLGQRWLSGAPAIGQALKCVPVTLSAEVGALALEAAGEVGDPGLRAEVQRIGRVVPAQRKKVSEVLVRLSATPESLLQWASSSGPNALWAARQLRRRDPVRFVRVLETYLQGATGWEGQKMFQALVELDRGKALRFARRLSRRSAADLRADVFLEIEDARTDAAALLGVLDRTRRLDDIEHILELLVPHPDPFVDPTLRRMLRDPKRVNASELCAKALLARRGKAVVPELIGLLRRPAPGHIRVDQLSVVTRAVLETGAGRSQLAAALRSLIRARPGQLVGELVLTAWIADLPELRPELERIGAVGHFGSIRYPPTSVFEGFGIFGSLRFSTEPNVTLGGATEELAEEVQRARRVLELWERPADAVRLAAFALRYDSQLQRDDRPERREALRARFARLEPAQRQKARAFLAWYEASRGQSVAHLRVLLD